ncbi:hypothetical protein C6T53_06470 [Burkholderia multivorans]|nr:hypothetical protein C6T53_06470 [Burkholderia multivorans]
MTFRQPRGPGTASEPDADPRLAGIRATLSDSRAVVNVRGVADVITLPPRDRARQNTACPLIRLGSQVEKNGMYVTMLIALKIAR